MSTGEIHEGPLTAVAGPVAAPARKPALGWREQRWRRRRRRKVGEEVLAWILVPLIVLGGYWMLSTVLAAMGTSPGAVIEQMKQAIQILEKVRSR